MSISLFALHIWGIPAELFRCLRIEFDKQNIMLQPLGKNRSKLLFTFVRRATL